jgi:hypothetical protein
MSQALPFGSFEHLPLLFIKVSILPGIHLAPPLNFCINACDTSNTIRHLSSPLIQKNDSVRPFKEKRGKFLGFLFIYGVGVGSCSRGSPCKGLSSVAGCGAAHTSISRYCASGPNRIAWIRGW